MPDAHVRIETKMAKRTRTQQQMTRRQVARRDRELRTQRIMIASAIVVGAIIFVVLVYGIVTELFIKARKPAARVDEVAITSRDFKARQAYERWMTQLEIYQYQSYLSQLSAQQMDLTTSVITDTEGTVVDDGTSALIQQLQVQVSSLENQLSPNLSTVFGGQVLDTMIEEELVRQEAAARGITVTEDEIERQTELLLGFDREAATAAVTDTETLTDTLALPAVEDFPELYKQFKTNVLDVTRFSDSDFQAMMEAQVLRERIQVELARDVDQVQDQVETIVFSAPTEETAETLRSRLSADGADPEAIAEELATGADDLSTAFTLPWLPLGYLNSYLGTDVERVAFNTPVGGVSPVVLASDGQFYVVYVLGHEERELSADLLASTEQQAYSEWLSQAKETRVEYLSWEEAIVTE